MLVSAACSAEGDPPPVGGEPGEPIPDLPAAELARFEAGRAAFARSFSPEEGLGPRFNENSCSACHTFPVDGGTGETSVRKATRHTGAGSCDLLTPQGGENIRIQVTPALRAAGGAPAGAPEEAGHRATFTIPFTFGLGLVEAVPLETLQELSDPDDADGDGISGRLGVDAAGRPARFGRKADVATLADFTDSAFRLEMGLTTPLHPDEARAGAIPAVPDGVDPAPEPEVDPATFAATVDFLRFLAPLARRDSDDPEVARGRTLFHDVGCADCHTPRLRTGDHEIAALAFRTLELHSDLLLHDMGPGLQGTCAPGAAPTEFRTEPLWGLGYRERFLHDGRATRVRDAILQHGGEASRARDAFAALDRVTQEALLAYLGTL